MDTYGLLSLGITALTIVTIYKHKKRLEINNGNTLELLIQSYKTALKTALILFIMLMAVSISMGSLYPAITSLTLTFAYLSIISITISITVFIIFPLESRLNIFKRRQKRLGQSENHVSEIRN